MKRRRGNGNVCIVENVSVFYSLSATSHAVLVLSTRIAKKGRTTSRTVYSERQSHSAWNVLVTWGKLFSRIKGASETLGNCFNTRPSHLFTWLTPLHRRQILCSVISLPQCSFPLFVSLVSGFVSCFWQWKWQRLRTREKSREETFLIIGMPLLEYCGLCYFKLFWIIRLLHRQRK